MGYTWREKVALRKNIAKRNENVLPIFLPVPDSLTRSEGANLAIIGLLSTLFGLSAFFWAYNYWRVWQLKQRVAKALLQRGHNEHKHGVFQIWGTHGYTAVVSPDFLEEIGNLPAGYIDFYEAAMKISNDRRLQVCEAGRLLVIPYHTILKDMTQKMWGLTPDLEEELVYAIRTEIPECKDWTAVTIQPKLLRIVALLTGRISVGPELNRNEEWIATSSSFMTDIYVAGAAKSVGSADQGTKSAHCQKPQDWMQGLMDKNSEEENPRRFEELSNIHLLLCFAALHTSTMAITHILFDLAAYPEYVKPLREEQRVVKEAFDCVPSKAAYLKMIKMDSFIKESQRHNPPSMLTYSRLVMKDFTLSNGVTFKPGAYFVIPAGPVLLDNDSWEDANEFRGFRFSEMRAQGPEESHKYQYATISNNALHFGHGRLGCPGRLFAGYETKAMTARFTEMFEIKLLDPKMGRPENTNLGAAVILDSNLQIILRKRN
ncbi:cytochrome P450 [Xylariaceae sp. FL0255]|nr:cytochrome P450 [Xylariaceae sp. FL0255]